MRYETTERTNAIRVNGRYPRVIKVNNRPVSKMRKRDKGLIYEDSYIKAVPFSTKINLNTEIINGLNRRPPHYGNQSYKHPIVASSKLIWQRLPNNISFTYSINKFNVERRWRSGFKRYYEFYTLNDTLVNNSMNYVKSNRDTLEPSYTFTTIPNDTSDLKTHFKSISLSFNSNNINIYGLRLINFPYVIDYGSGTYNPARTWLPDARTETSENTTRPGGNIVERTETTTRYYLFERMWIDGSATERTRGERLDRTITTIVEWRNEINRNYTTRNTTYPGGNITERLTTIDYREELERKFTNNNRTDETRNIRSTETGRSVHEWRRENSNNTRRENLPISGDVREKYATINETTTLERKYVNNSRTGETRNSSTRENSRSITEWKYEYSNTEYGSEHCEPSGSNSQRCSRAAYYYYHEVEYVDGRKTNNTRNKTLDHTGSDSIIGW